MPSFLPAFDFHAHVVVPWQTVKSAPWGESPQAATLWTVLMGALVAIACGWIGCYLILQGMALVGDAISHTVLLGLVIAVLMTGQVTGVAVFVAAIVTGVLTTIGIEALHRTSRLKEDAAIGIVFTSLFALGVVLLATQAGRAHIDTQHVLYGQLEFVAFGPSRTFAGIAVPVALLQMLGLVVVLAVLIVAFYKELLAVAFDRQLAASLGIRPAIFQYALLGVLSLAVVCAFSSVGAVLVVGMLIAPAATAYLMTSRLPLMFFWSALAGTLSSLIGFHVAWWLEVSTAASMACTACGLFAVAFFFSPKQGLVAAAIRRARVRMRIARENVVRHMLRHAAAGASTPVSAAEIAAALQIPAWRLSRVLRGLARVGLVEAVPAQAGAWRLTPAGLAEARRLDRAHRLWETYLVRQIGLPSDHVHLPAEEVEHVLSEQLVERLDDALGHPDVDPHGKPIPRSPISDQAPGRFALSKLRVGDRGRIAGLLEHAAGVESVGTPGLPAVADLGLTLGQEIAVVERDSTTPSWTIQLPDGRRLSLAHHLADSVVVDLGP